MFEFVLNVTIAGAGAALFILPKPLARGLSEWSAKQYNRFPRLKLLPGSDNAGTALNYRITFIWFPIKAAAVEAKCRQINRFQGAIQSLPSFRE